MAIKPVPHRIEHHSNFDSGDVPAATQVLTYADPLWDAQAGGGGGGAPTDASYVVGAAHAGLSAELVLDTAVIMAGTEAARPAASLGGRIYFATDTLRLFRDTGAAWVTVGVQALAELATRAHASLTAIGANDHHTQDHGSTDHSGAVLPGEADENLGDHFLDAGDISTPSNPAAGVRRMFTDVGTGELSVRTSAGTTVSLEGGGGGGAPTNAQYVVMALNGTLTDERVLTPGTGLDLTDGGAGGNATLDVDISEFTLLEQIQRLTDTLLLFDSSAADEKIVEPYALHDPRYTWQEWDDCMYAAVIGNNGHTKAGITAGINGTGVQITPATTVQSGVSRFGVLQLETGTTAAGLARLFSAADAILLGGGKFRFMAEVRVEDLSTSTERFGLAIGLGDSNNEAGTDVIDFRYRDDVNAGNWQLRTRSNATETVADSGITVAADTWYTLEFEVNAAASSVEFFIDGTSVGTITTNIPSGAGRQTGIRILVLKTVGTTERLVYLDAYGWAYDYDTGK